MKRQLFLGLLLLTAPAWATVVDFEEYNLAENSFYPTATSGQTGLGSKGASFQYNYDAYSWDGFLCSNNTDTITPGYGNQYSAITGQGVEGSNNYAIAYLPLDWNTGAIKPRSITFDKAADVSGAYFTNTTYTYLSMKDGDDFATKFSEGDYLTLFIRGFDAQNNLTGQTSFDLGRGLSLVNSWTWVDLSGLGTVSRVEFLMAGTDISFGFLNTPTYFAMDNLTFVPEPATLLLMGLGGIVLTRKRIR